MSLRWRLTISSSIILALVFALFSTGAYFTIKTRLYDPIDQNLQQQTMVNLIYFSKLQSMVYDLGNKDQFGSVTFSLIDTVGHFYGREPNVPFNEWLFAKASSGSEAWGYAQLPDGKRARVYYAPIILTDQGTGQKALVGVILASTPLDIPDQIMSQMVLFLAVFSILLLIVGAVGSYLLAGRALRVVNRVTLQAQRIQTSQDLSQRIPAPATDDEIGNLVLTFNAMLSRLDAAFAAQRRFVADSSHELRTPLTVIKGNLHLLKRASDPVERTELISITEGEISRLNRMVNDLLYMAQMQAGRDLKPVPRTVELDSLLLDVFSLGRSMSALKDQRVVLTHEDIASTNGDRDQLQHLLLNLLDNAIKYTPVGGLITLGLWAEGGWARIEVGDTGAGIAQSDLEMLFDRFYRTPSARRSEHDGSGLGLAIVKSIAEAHNGSVEVQSQEGHGSTFRVWLPLDVSKPYTLNSTDESYELEQVPALPSPNPEGNAHLESSPRRDLKI